MTDDVSAKKSHSNECTARSFFLLAPPVPTNLRIRSIFAALLIAGVSAAGWTPESVAESGGWKRVDTIPEDAESVKAHLPVYSQAVVVQVPAGWAPANEKTRGSSYIFEAIPREESLDDWTGMLTVQGFKGLAHNPKATPKAVAHALGRRIRKICPDSVVFEPLGSTEVDSFEAYRAVIGCGSISKPLNGARPGQGEIAYTLVIRGRDDLYLIQRAQRGYGFDDANPPISEHNVSEIDASLQPIKLCDRDKPKTECWERRAR